MDLQPGNIVGALGAWWQKEASPLTKTIIGLTSISVAAALVLLLSPRIFLYILIGTMGFTMIWKTVWWIGTFGRIAWAEEHLTSGFGGGAGGSWLLYKLLGIITIIAVILHWTGSLERIFVSIFGNFFPN